MDLEETARKEATRVEDFMSSLDVVDEKAKSLVEVLESYRKDCKSFLEKGQFLQSLEAAFICWAYVDAGLHLKVFKISDKFKDIFTV